MVTDGLQATSLKAIEGMANFFTEIKSFKSNFLTKISAIMVRFEKHEERFDYEEYGGFTAWYKWDL